MFVFKKGDRVRHRSSRKEGTVTGGIEPDKKLWVSWDSGGKSLVSHAYLELMKRPPEETAFKRGDIVLKRDNYNYTGSVNAICYRWNDTFTDGVDEALVLWMVNHSLTRTQWCPFEDLIKVGDAFPEGGRVEKFGKPQLKGTIHEALPSGKVIVKWDNHNTSIAMFPCDLTLIACELNSVPEEEEMGRGRRLKVKRRREEKRQSSAGESVKDPTVRTLRVKLREGNVVYMSEDSAGGIIQYIMDSVKLGETQIVTLKASDMYPERTIEISLKTLANKHMYVLPELRVSTAQEIKSIQRGPEETMDFSSGVVNFQKCTVCKELKDPKKVQEIIHGKNFCGDCIPRFTDALYQICRDAEEKVSIYR